MKNRKEIYSVWLLQSLLQGLQTELCVKFCEKTSLFLRLAPGFSLPGAPGEILVHWGPVSQYLAAKGRIMGQPLQKIVLPARTLYILGVGKVVSRRETLHRASLE